MRRVRQGTPKMSNTDEMTTCCVWERLSALSTPQMTVDNFSPHQSLLISSPGIGTSGIDGKQTLLEFCLGSHKDQVLQRQPLILTYSVSVTMLLTIHTLRNIDPKFQDHWT